jgi:hypothetical protein
MAVHADREFMGEGTLDRMKRKATKKLEAVWTMGD